ncbi:molybdopterin-guanine dinucleotide biosynthesis protein A [Paenibacillus sp. 1_12]|uniref:molybdenum cofactor guanylyltransferase n=1 Tax=Paenibacillus sp. 1_12 TaxID=1566278 RepID=UPI0008EAA857|nr:molybdenum cofactor guanylyltransferase [Paenibacillus sp. 1_12]SFK77855.1 molybdopterin-guanine dinucleotide biosynthesis protein A [Paenibacillus sp. 1_12]
MLSGIILAGGDSLRMSGENKSLLLLGEEAIIVRQIRIMRELCSEVIIVTNTPKPFLRVVDASVRIITDYIPGKGPLSGMHAGITLSRNRSAWVVGCDMPFLSPAAAELMLRKKKAGLDAIIPWFKGVMHPLHGIYDRDCAGHIWTLLKNQDSELSSLRKGLLWQETVESEFHAVGIECSFVTTIKTRDDYFLAQQHLEKTKVQSG